MNELFLKIINMSISASWLVLAVLILRFVLKKAPKWVNVLLWGIVAVRLICPFSFESALSLIPSAETIPLNIGMDTTPTINSGINAINNAVNPIISQSNTPMAGASINPLQITIGVYEYIWIFGMIALALYTAISYWRLRRKVDTAIRYKDNIFQSENVNSSFVLGIIKPRIYLPFNMNEQDLEHVVAHEQTHIRRKDHCWKPLGFLLLTIHWFNPLMWLAYVLLCRDIELACDEKVIKELGNEQRADYTQALVACSVNCRMIAACPLAFGEVGVKERVKSVMNYKKPAFWIVVIAVLTCVIVAVCFLTNPVDKEPDLSFLNYESAISLVADVDEVMAIYCPSSDNGSNGSIQVGAATGIDLAKQLDRWDWKECSAPRQTLPSPGSVEFIIEEDYRITVHQRKSGSLRQYAVVKYQDDIRYYSIDKSDYPDAVALVHAPKNITDREAIGKTYLYEKEGIMGHFQITLYDDGTFIYYEGLASSYLGTGTWHQEGNIITLSDDETVGYALVNHFTLDGDSLVFIEKESSNFIYVKVANGEHFNLTGEAFKPNNSNETSSTTNETWGITLIVENVTPTGITIKCTQSGGEPTGELRTGSWYILETWTQEEGWHEDSSHAEVCWTDEAWIISKDSVTEWEVNWEWLYGALSEGKYRIGKEIMDFRGTGDYDKAIYFAEFKVLNGVITKTIEDCFIKIEKLKEILKGKTEKVFLVGDLNIKIFEEIKSYYENLSLAPQALRLPDAASIGFLAMEMP